METRTCKVCGRELPETEFPQTKSGTRFATCRECRTAALRRNKAANRQTAPEWGGKTAPVSDADFDGKDPGDVIRTMGRAKKWLESRGFIIRLSGEFHETKIRKLKFE